jgi:hypothetical protein
MPRLRSFDELRRPPPSQLCAECSTLRAEWLDVVGKTALEKLRFGWQWQVTPLDNAEVEAFRRYVDGRRQYRICNKRGAEMYTAS